MSCPSAYRCTCTTFRRPGALQQPRAKFPLRFLQRQILFRLEIQHPDSRFPTVILGLKEQGSFLWRRSGRVERFSNAYTPSPICVPARASLATGHYVHEVGCWDNAIAYDGTPDGWAQHLSNAGLVAESIGKLHYRSASSPAGFRRQQHAVHIHDGIGQVWGSVRDPMPETIGRSPLYDRIGEGESDYNRFDARVADSAVEWLAQHANADKPWTRSWAWWRRTFRWWYRKSFWTCTRSTALRCRCSIHRVASPGACQLLRPDYVHGSASRKNHRCCGPAGPSSVHHHHLQQRPRRQCRQARHVEQMPDVPRVDRRADDDLRPRHSAGEGKRHAGVPGRYLEHDTGARRLQPGVDSGAGPLDRRDCLRRLTCPIDWH